MNGYSNLQVVENTETRSVDYSDLVPKAISETNNLENPETDDQIKAPNPSRGSPAEREGVDGEGSHGATTGPNLRRNSSVASAYALQTAVRRAFSVTRSSSVSERYCRIHEEPVTAAAPFDDEQVMGTTRSETKKSSRGKILKAWKKLFGL